MLSEQPDAWYISTTQISHCLHLLSKPRMSRQMTLAPLGEAWGVSRAKVYHRIKTSEALQIPRKFVYLFTFYLSTFYLCTSSLFNPISTSYLPCCLRSPR